VSLTQAHSKTKRQKGQNLIFVFNFKNFYLLAVVGTGVNDIYWLIERDRFVSGLVSKGNF
jgi:hypothetical protein